MSNYYIYADSNTGYFARLCDRPLTDFNLIQVPSLPPNINYKWNGVNWINLTVTEIEEKNQVAEPKPEIDTAELQTNTTTIPNSVVFWGNTTGDRLINSGMVLKQETLSIPYNLNLINKKYLVNGMPKDRQKIILVNQERYDQEVWQLIPDMVLTSANLEPSLYKIEIELLVKVSKNDSEFEVGLFINSNQIIENSLNLNFKAKDDDKIIVWSDEIILNPYSLVEVYWRSGGKKNTGYVERRKLQILEQ